MATTVRRDYFIIYIFSWSFRAASGLDDLERDLDEQEGTYDKTTQKGFLELDFLFLLLEMADVAFFFV